jgi:hypothetical protein
VDGAQGPLTESIKPGTLQFTDDGHHVAWVALDGVHCSRIVVDGSAGYCREGVASLRVTESGAVAILHDGGHFRMLNGDVLGPPWDAIGEWTVTEDGRHLAYAARGAGRWSVVVDGEVRFHAQRVRDLRFGDGGGHLVFAAIDPPRSRVVHDGTQGPDFLLVGTPQIAERGSRMAYAAEDEHGAWLVVDGEREGPFSAVLDVTLSRDGNHLAYVVRKNGSVRVIHDGEEHAFEALVPRSFVLSEDGEHWAVIAGELGSRRLWISLDGVRSIPIIEADVFGDDRGLAPWVRQQLATSLGLEAKP